MMLPTCPHDIVHLPFLPRRHLAPIDEPIPARSIPSTAHNTGPLLLVLLINVFSGLGHITLPKNI